MGDLPKVVVDVVRMAIRAFYEDMYIVIIDSILYEKNYCKEDNLFERLRMPGKDVRLYLDRMRRTKLLKNEKRQQRKVVLNKGPGWFRSVESVFWWVDFATIIDIVKYKLYIIRQSIAHTIKTELEHQRYMCSRCKRTFTALDVVRLMDEAGILRCDKEIGRRRQCMGEVVEEDTAGALTKARLLQAKMEEDLRPIIELLKASDEVKIPSHPLEGVDDSAWGKYVPDTLGAQGEDLIATHTFAMYGGRAPTVEVEIAEDMDASAVDAKNKKKGDHIPEKPLWFKPDDGTNASGAAPGAAGASEGGFKVGGEFGAGKPGLPFKPREEDNPYEDYYETYMRQQQELLEKSAKNAATASAADAEAGKIEDGKDGDMEIETPSAAITNQPIGEQEGDEEFDANFVDVPADVAGASSAGEPNGTAEEETSDPSKMFVTVAGEKVLLENVTEEHTEKMTSTEYQDYYDKLRKAGYINMEDE